MKDLELTQRRWLREQLKLKGRGARTALAERLHIQPAAISRMTNIDGAGESRDISVTELVGMAEFFNAEPPGLAAARQVTEAPLTRRDRITRVSLISWVSAGRLVNAESQIPEDDVQRMAFAGLGSGEFFALKVEGDSMDRQSPEGSIIVVNRADKHLINGKAYVFWHRAEGTTYKLWHADGGYLAPYSTNPAHEPIIIKRKKDFGIVGRVRRSVLDL